MNISIHVFILWSFALTGLAAADVPKKASLGRYNRLWTDSPFTVKPPPPEGVAQVNPLDDYALIGVSSIGPTGFRVTLINKKIPTERITVDSGTTKDGFKIISVNRKPGDPLGTVVNMSSGTMVGTVAFDQKLLTLATPSPQATPPPQAPPGEIPTILPGDAPPPQRQPRPRVVPPPVPQVPIQPQPQQIPKTNIQRPMRRSS